MGADEPLFVVMHHDDSLSNDWMRSEATTMRRTLLIRFLFAVPFLWSSVAAEPVPSFYQEPGLSPQRDYVDQHFAERIDPFTGKLQLHYTDLFIPGNGGLDIKVQRSYNSLNELLVEPSAVGVGWTMHYGRVLRRSSLLSACALNVIVGNAPVLETPDGHRHILYLSPDTSHWLTSSRWRARCASNGIGLIVQSPDGTTYEMTTPGAPISTQNSWYTTRIVDRNGNVLNFQYLNVNGDTVLSRIDASDGRFVRFDYNGSTLASFTDGTRTWSYEYEIGAPGPTFPFLKRVVRPDGAAWAYEYNLPQQLNFSGNYSMRKVTYPTGGSYTYTYGFVTFNTLLPRSTVVSRKVGSDNNQWTFAYTPASTPCAWDQATQSCSFSAQTSYDRTQVTGPDGTIEYGHIGANSIRPGLVWTIGLQLFKNSDAGYEFEQPFFNGQLISNMRNDRPGSFLVADFGIVAPILVARSINRNNQTYLTEYSNHDTFGNPRTIRETGPNGVGGLNVRTTQVTYYIDQTKWIIRLPQQETTDTIGTIARTFDGNANMLTENKYGVTTTFTYTPEGDIATKRDARNNTISYSNYKRGTPQNEAHPEGVSIARAVSDAGNVTDETDGEGATVRYGYDGLNRITGIQHPRGNPVGVTWQPNLRVVTRGNYVETTSFDGYGRVASVNHRDTTSGAVIAQNHLYDAYGRQVFASYPNDSKGTRTRYDMLGRVELLEHAAAPTGPAAASMSKSYQGQSVLLVNENSRQYAYDYRGFGDADKTELMTVRTPVPTANMAITRNGLGQPASITQDGKTRSYQYDPRFFLTTQTEPETGTTVFGRDEVGNMTSRRVASSGTTNFTYDGRNRLATVIYPAGTPNVTRTYYRDDKLRTLVNSSATREYTYDPNKNLTQEKLTVGASVFTTDYTYDGNDALGTLRYGSGNTIDYAADAFGRPTKAGGYVPTVEHHPNGALKRMVFANGIQTDIALDPRLRPQSINAGGAAPVSSLSYGYDLIGNVTSLTDAAIPALNRTLGYDPIDRLTSAVSRSGLGAATYDGRGNLRNQSLGRASLSLSYDGSDRLIQATGTLLSDQFGTIPISLTYGYDVYGNVTNQGSATFAYNDAQQMRCARCGTANEVTYAYDGAGMRVSSTVSGGTTFFVYGNGGNLLWEVAPNGEFKEYIYVAGKQAAVRRVTP
jgi:YD repeat-containing protein